MHRTTLALRLLLPAFLIGAIVAISFLEAPLKFQAPGITIRPVLNRRSDLVIAGAEAPGTDWAHYAYIAADVTVLALLVALVVVTVREVLPDRTAVPDPARTRVG